MSATPGSGWRPLSVRGSADPRFDGPTEGLPRFLASPVIEWVKARFDRHPQIRQQAMQRLQLRFRLDRPFSSNSRSALANLGERMRGSQEFALDVLDYVLNHLPEFVLHDEDPATEWIDELRSLLRQGGSEWEVVPLDETGGFRLSRRAIGPVAEVLEELAPGSRAHQHLLSAWAKVAGRNPDHSGAYREAVRAVEAAGKPVISPDDKLATMGRMISALRDKPEKWETTLGSVEDVRLMMELVWSNQLDRHGTSDEEVPLNVSPEQADAAFHVCLVLTRLLAGGHLRQAR